MPLCNESPCPAIRLASGECRERLIISHYEK